MKKHLSLLFLLSSFSVFSQDLPTLPAIGYSFPIGNKFTIEMVRVDSVNFSYSIIEFEPFEEVIDYFSTDTLFKDEGKPGTIEFYFCLGTSGETEEEREKNMKVVLTFKNRTEFNFSYQSDILVDENGEFEETSNMGSYPGAIGNEWWPYMIYEIGLHDFKLKE